MFDLSLSERLRIFKIFYKNWFTIRGICRRINISSPPTPRFYISIPMREKSLTYSLYIDDDDVESIYSGNTLKASGSNSSISSEEETNTEDIFIHEKVPYLQKIRTTPDILQTIKPNKRSISNQNFLDQEIDPGFCSDVSWATEGTALKKLDELQKQFNQMQKDIAALVQAHSFGHQGPPNDSSSFFNPNVTSSPNYNSQISSKVTIRADLFPVMGPPPPPPCPPPPPPISINWRQTLPVSKETVRPHVPKGMPDMSEILKGITSVRLRPIDQGVNKRNCDLSPKPMLLCRTPLRPVMRHESIIATALRERFNRFRDLHEDESTTVTSVGEWSEDNEDCSHHEDSRPNFGRSLLRKVDRSQLPATVCQDL